MAISAGEILYKLSIKTGAAGNAAAQPNVNASLGTWVSTTQLSATALNNAFDNITGAENAASVVDYRCVFIHNSNATLPLTGAVVWLSGGDPAGGAAVTIAVDTTASSAVGAAVAQGLTAATETAPGAGVTGLAYSAPTTSAGGLALGDIPAGFVKAVWIKRAAANTAPVNAETITLAVTGDTAA